ncbi:HAD-IA family hydrolase [Candidatus Gottesmanbacteria bacterium]|nr:HAD-IA family hydrolase [Candidatus Gottesmanbacteria bacterium]
MAKHHQKDVKEVYEIFHKYDDLTCRGIITPQQLSRGMHKDLGRIYDEKLDISRLARKYFQPIEKMHRLINKLADKMPVGLLTNIYLGFLEMSFDHKFLPKLKYSAIIKSCDLGIIKPEKEIYLHAQKMAGVESSEILFIDDYEKNTAAAKKLGWQVFTFNNSKIDESIKSIEEML